MMATALLATAAALLCSSPPAYPSPVLGFLSRALGDSMVLQFDKAVVWGNTTANATVTTTITYRSTNPHLPKLGGLQEVLSQIADFAGIVVGAELRRLRAIGPAIAAVDWSAHDA